MKAKVVTDEQGRFYAVRIVCPGCAQRGSWHLLETDWMPPGMERTPGHRKDGFWGFNGNLDKPTFTPSLKVEWTRWDGEKRLPYICHSFIREGRIQFLGDCTHALAGQTVDLLDISEEAAA